MHWNDPESSREIQYLLEVSKARLATPSPESAGAGLLEIMAAARQAADDCSNVVHDRFHGDKLRLLCERGLLYAVFVPVNVGTDGFQFRRKNVL